MAAFSGQTLLPGARSKSETAWNVAVMKFYDGSKRFWIVVSVFGVIVAILGWFSFLAIKQRRDMAAVREYVSRVQPQLDADPRFKDVRLLGYGCDYIMHPYMPVLGTVPTQLFVIMHPDDHGQVVPSRRGRPLRDALALLAQAAPPDPEFGTDMEAVLRDVGRAPADPWAPS